MRPVLLMLPDDYRTGELTRFLARDAAAQGCQVKGEIKPDMDAFFVTRTDAPLQSTAEKHS